jgi:hypothetical protein
MSLCVYKRIREEPVRLNLNGRVVIVRRGETIVAETIQMMGVSGFAFMGIYGQKDNFGAASSNLTVSRPKPLIDEPEEFNIQVQEVNQQPSKPAAPIIVEAPVIHEPQKVVANTKPVGFNKETIERLKTLDNKQWFSLKKEDIIKFLEDANIEYKHISSDKWELAKFLKKIIKEL